MLKRDQAHLILELYKKGCRIQRIQQALQISRATVLRAIYLQSPDPPQQKDFSKPEMVLIDNTHLVVPKDFQRRR